MRDIRRVNSPRSSSLCISSSTATPHQTLRFSLHYATHWSNSFSQLIPADTKHKSRLTALVLHQYPDSCDRARCALRDVTPSLPWPHTRSVSIICSVHLAVSGPAMSALASVLPRAQSAALVMPSASRSRSLSTTAVPKRPTRATSSSSKVRFKTN